MIIFGYEVPETLVKGCVIFTLVVLAAKLIQWMTGFNLWQWIGDLFAPKTA